MTVYLGEAPSKKSRQKADGATAMPNGRIQRLNGTKYLKISRLIGPDLPIES
jgi:hypothetical protein